MLLLEPSPGFHFVAEPWSILNNNYNNSELFIEHLRYPKLIQPTYFICTTHLILTTAHFTCEKTEVQERLAVHPRSQGPNVAEFRFKARFA